MGSVIALSLILFVASGYVHAQELFTLHQEILTTGGIDWESFTVDDESYLVVANSANNGGPNDRYQVDSIVYKWDGSNFVQHQVIPTSGAIDWESFQINGTTYIAVAFHVKTAYIQETESIIYEWNANDEEFVVLQSITTQSAWDWESFEIDGIKYLAVANRSNQGQTTLDSRIYKWNGSNFSEYQSILTHGATAWESFVIDGEMYLMVVNSEGSVSVIYKWNVIENRFELFQEVATNSPIDVESFQINGATYLYVLPAANPGVGSDSIIYKWNGSDFSEFQTLENIRGWELESFHHNGRMYLAISTHFGGEVLVYKFSDTDFIEYRFFL